MEKITIKRAIPADAKGIVKARKVTWLATYPNRKYKITKALIEKMNINSPARVKRTRERIKSRNERFWVAKSGKSVVGFCSAHRTPKENNFGSLYILPKYQGRGLGTRLMRQALEWFKNESVLRVKVAVYNKSAIRFYKKFGFKVVRKKADGPLLPDGRSFPSIEMMLRQSTK